MPSLFSKGIYYGLEIHDVLYLVNEEIGSPAARRQLVNQGFELVGGLDLAAFAYVQVEIDDVVLVNSVFAQFLGDGFHQAGFAAASDACNDLDQFGVMVKSSNRLKIVFSLIHAHSGRIVAQFSNLGQVKGVKMNNQFVLTPLFQFTLWVLS